MKKHFKRKSSLIAPRNKPGVAGLIDKMQQQLSTMEEKLDILISQSSKRPFEKSYSQKPFQRFNHSHRHDRGDSTERTYTRVICADCNKECEVPFKPSGNRPVYCKECFPKHKEGSSFNANRDNRAEERSFPRKRRPYKRQDEKRQKPDKKKSPFFARRKN